MNEKTKYIVQLLRDTYRKVTISKKELANELGVSLSTIDLYISKGVNLPNYKKQGNAKNAKLIFNIIDVAEFLTDTIKVA